MNWTRGRILGRGSSAAVSLATAHSGEVLAVKSVELSGSEILRREQSFLCKLNCPQIVAYKGCDTTLENGKMMYNLFMEYAPGGAIGGGGRLDEAAIRSYARPVLLGIEYLHCRGIVHCDIKGQNIVLAEEGAKIADLGCAKWASDKDAPISGTPAFMAPEVARGEQQGFAADIWALGCTVIETATGRSPWGGASDPVPTLYRVGYSGETPDIPSFMSEQGRDFLGKCLTKSPAERWSARELLKHPFLDGPTKCVSPEIGGFDSDTPTGVLDDQGLWDSISTATKPQFPVSPAERIRRLGGGAAAEWDENDWVTVRSYVGSLMRGNEATTITILGHDYHKTPQKNILPYVTEKLQIRRRGRETETGEESGQDNSELSNVIISKHDNEGTFVTSKCIGHNVTCGNLSFHNINEEIVGFSNSCLHQFLFYFII